MPADIDCEVSSILGRNPRILEICRMIDIIGKTNATVLVQGETGTGKELVANAIQAHSPRSNKPFIKVNCAALSETLLESELFGHQKGAFTGARETRKGVFELAPGGTILLDEIDNMSLTGQAKLLRVLQEDKIVSVEDSIPIKIGTRVIATTNVILKKAIRQGAFHEDLFDQLSMITIFIPPLRERREDIPILAKNFIKFDSYETKRHIKGISSKALDALVKYEWPGNVRELKDAIEHAVIIEHTDTIQIQSLPPHVLKGCWDCLTKDIEDFNLKRRVQTYERQIIFRALIKADWVKSRAAQLLGIDQRNLSYFIRKHHILDLMKNGKSETFDL